MKAKLYDYQRIATNFIKQNNRCGLFLDMGLGKACDDETDVLTYNRGQIKIKNVVPGDYLYDRQGQPTKVLTVYPHKNIRSFMVTLADNRSFICCDEHLIPYIGTDAQIKQKPLKQIAKNYLTKAYQLPENNALEFSAYYEPLQLHPYSLGQMLGRDWPEKQETLKKFGFIGTKNELIPEKYIKTSINNRILLLRGFIVMSNEPITKTTDNKYHYRYRTTNKELVEQLLFLCRSLGFSAYSENNNWDTLVHIFTDISIKNNQHEIQIDQRPRKTPTIIDIKEVNPRNMTCFTVDNPEHLYLINDFIVTHNTLVTLTALAELAVDQQLFGHTLVIAPKRIAALTWPDEILQWDHTKNARFETITGLTKKKRDLLFDAIPNSPPTIYLANREIVPQIVDRFPGKSFPFLNLVLDEAQSFKNYGSVRFKKLKTVIPYTHRIIELTGTPSPNGLMDIWSLIYLIDGGARLGKNITAYRETHFSPGRRTPEGYPYEWLLQQGHEEFIHKQIKDVVISMSKKDYLTMPDVVHNIIECEMSKKERAIYNELKKEHVLTLVGGETIEAVNAAVLSGALLQLSNGAIYKDKQNKDIIELHKHKLEALEEIVDGANGHSVLCFYWFKHDLLRLQQHFPDSETFDGTSEQLKRWNNKEIPLLFAQPASAGHGLNFQYGGHIMAFFSVPTSLELYEQSIARLHRNGQTETVIVHYIKTKGTVEDIITKRLIEKQLTQQALIDAVKVELEELDG